jgi:hydroxymethylglutaryl-CoA lyase
MSELVRITDVSPRDGLQNEPGRIATTDKAHLVQLLLEARLDEIEATSFVSPAWVPQLGDAAELIRMLPLCASWGGRWKGPTLSVLVPNMKGMDEAMRLYSETAVFSKICLFTAASEMFNKRNTNASIAESLERFVPVLKAAHADRLAVKLYVSCAFGCPFEGDVPEAQVEKVVRECLALLARPDFMPSERGELSEVELSLGDTIGVARPARVTALCDRVGPQGAQTSELWAELASRREARLNLHLHDTFGRAAECVCAGLAAGVRSFDGSVAGLGGCPYASTPGKRAPGNISTELLVRTVQEEGYTTGVRAAALETAAGFARDIVAASRQRVEDKHPGGGGGG